MMDSQNLYDEPVHPSQTHMKRDLSGLAKKPHTRTARPVKYYHIDFGLSRIYDPKLGPPCEHSGQDGYGGDRSVPEFKISGYCDPFRVDVYRVGNLVREIRSVRPLLRSDTGYLVLKSPLQGEYHWEPGSTDERKILGLDFLEPLLQDMCQDDPEKRPTMDEVMARFTKIVNALSGWKLRSRLRRLGVSVSMRQLTVHWATQITRVARRVPSIPTPPPRV